MELSKLQFFEINSLDELSEIRDNWKKLFGKLSNITPFQSWEWNWSFAEDYYTSRNLKILVLQLDNEILGIAPFILKYYLFKSIKVLEFIGSKESDYLNILCIEEYKQIFMEKISNWLFNNREWTEISLSGLSLDDAEQFKSLNNSFQITELDTCPYLTINGPFSNYIESLPSGLRKKTKRIINKLDKSNSLSVKYYTDKIEIMNSLDIFFELHQKRFTSKGQRGKFYNESLKKRFRAITDRVASNNLVLLIIIYIDNKPVYIDYLFSYQKILYGYLGGMDPDYMKFSLGNISKYFLIKKSYIEGIKIIDFMRGNEPYKANWTNNEKKIYVLSFSKNKIISYFRKGIDAAKKRLSKNELVMKIYSMMA